LDAQKTTVAELETMRDGWAQERKAAEDRVAELTAKLAEVEAKLTTYSEAEAAETHQAKLASRLSSLPAHIQTLHAQKDSGVKEKIEAKWMAMDDETWETYVAEELLGYDSAKVRVSFLDRSNSRLPIPAIDESDDISSRVRAVLR
jgi:hypothetical protein